MTVRRAALLPKSKTKVVRIPLGKGRFAVIDVEDYGKVKKHKWYAQKIAGRYYAVSRNTRHGLLHRLIVDAAINERTKFESENKLDCRKSNIVKWKIEHSKKRPYIRKKIRIDTYSKIKTKDGVKIKIPLTKGFHAIIDPCDFNLVSKYTWRTSGEDGDYYAATNMKVKRNVVKLVRLHNFIMKPKESKRVDHRDRNWLNHVRKNLRICSVAQNNQNRVSKKNRQYRYRGIYLYNNRWLATIRFDRKLKHLGRYDTDIQAAKAYDEAAKKYHGEFAVLNFPENR